MQSTVKQNPLIAHAQHIMDIELEAIVRLKERLDAAFVEAIELLKHCQGRVVVTGMGKSGIIGKKIAATFSSTGTPALFLHPGEGVHGDLGMLMPGDCVIAISNSGETPELLQVLPVVRRFNLPLIAITGNQQSTLAKRSQVVLDCSVDQEACPYNLAPTASTTATLVLGDALALVLMEQKGFTPEAFAVFHPAGSLGKRLLLTVEDVMHTGDDVPTVPITATFQEALLEITTKRLGMTVVEDTEGRACGVITDGDVRRILLKHFHELDRLLVHDVFSPNPKRIAPSDLASDALAVMETHKITTLLVITPDSEQLLGLIHLHDLLKTGL